MLTAADRLELRTVVYRVIFVGLPFLPLLALWPSKSVTVNGWNDRPIRNGKYPQCDFEPTFYCSILVAIGDIIGARAAKLGSQYFDHGLGTNLSQQPKQDHSTGCIWESGTASVAPIGRYCIY